MLPMLYLYKRRVCSWTTPKLRQSYQARQLKTWLTTSQLATELVCCYPFALHLQAVLGQRLPSHLPFEHL